MKSGVVKTLTNDDANLRYAMFSPDGKSVVYNRSGNTGTWWRPRYKSSATMHVYAKALDTGKITKVASTYNTAMQAK